MFKAINEIIIAAITMLQIKCTYFKCNGNVMQCRSVLIDIGLH